MKTFSRRQILTSAIGCAFTAWPVAAQTGGAMRYGPSFPMSIAWVRFNPDGHQPHSQLDYKTWSMAVRRLGRLVSRMESVNGSFFLPIEAPVHDDGASAAAWARDAAIASGYDAVLIYALKEEAIEPNEASDAEKAELNEADTATEADEDVEVVPRMNRGLGDAYIMKSTHNPIFKFLSGATSEVASSVKRVPGKITGKPTGTLFGEAYLLDSQTGAVLAESHVETDITKAWGMLRKKRNAEKEVLEMLAQDIAQDIVTLAAPLYQATRSIAD